jgi:hypothetical protein
MQTYQLKWENNSWKSLDLNNDNQEPNMILVFSDRASLQNGIGLKKICEKFPNSIITGCSTAGEIQEDRVYDESLVATAIYFEKTKVRSSRQTIQADSLETGKLLAKQIDPNGLKHVIVFSDGLKVNGSELVKGLNEYIPSDIVVTGGLAADGGIFHQTLTIFDGEVRDDSVVAVGFYGDAIDIRYGSFGGWDSFGPERYVSKSTSNILFELDGQPALDLYKTYLGEHAAGLPATGLLFPLCIKIEGQENLIVRTILAVDEAAKSITFAGDVPQGCTARLMKANFDRLIDGAMDAARIIQKAEQIKGKGLALLVSCVGRKMVLGQRVEDEVDAVREILGANFATTGFYSYGEIAPFRMGERCELHNQTMTVTTFHEK